MMRCYSCSLLSLAVVLVLVSLVMNYIVIELSLLVMNYIVHLNEYLYILPVLEAPRPGRQPKQAVVNKIKPLYLSVTRQTRVASRAQYIRWFTDEYNGPPVSPPPPPCPITFIGHQSLMNITGYIHRLRVTDEYMVIVIGTDE
jgi:hypothetical protein